MVGNAGNFFAWVFLYMIGVLLIIAGVQGSAGRMLAVALCPNKLDVGPAVFGPYGSNWISPLSQQTGTTQTQTAVYQ